MTADQPLTCSTCQGVIVTAQDGAYTPARGRLIVTNGYCRGQCSANPPQPAASTAPAPADRPEPAPVNP